MKTVILLILLLLGPSLAAQDLPDPEWIKLEPVQQVRDNSHYHDILAHSRERFRSYGNQSTTAHEIQHGIHSWLRNHYRKGCGLYVGGGKAILLDHPRITIGLAAPYVPQELRGGRYHLYLVQQRRDWDRDPLYLLDEHHAYLTSCQVAMETPGGTKTDNAMAPLEFAIYSTAVGMAARDHDPEYWKSNQEFRRLLAWTVRRSFTLYHESQKHAHLQWDGGRYLKKIEASEFPKFWKAMEQ